MKIAVIVPVYRQWGLIPNLITTFKKITLSDCRIEFILVDNEPGTDKNVSEINLVECQKPGSYAARNAGIRNSSADLFLFTDADCIPSAEWLESIRLAYKQSDKKSLLAGNVIIRSNNTHPTIAELYDIAAGLPQERYVSKGYAVTANLAIPKIVFDEIGLFDDSRFSGGDAEFCQRAREAGFGLKFVREAIVYHPARTTWEEYATKVRRMKGGQIRAGKLSRRMKYFFITLLPPVWRFWRIIKSGKLKFSEKLRVVWFQFRLWLVELTEMFALLCGKTPERR